MIYIYDFVTNSWSFRKTCGWSILAISSGIVSSNKKWKFERHTHPRFFAVLWSFYIEILGFVWDSLIFSLKTKDFLRISLVETRKRFKSWLQRDWSIVFTSGPHFRYSPKIKPRDGFRNDAVLTQLEQINRLDFVW